MAEHRARQQTARGFSEENSCSSRQNRGDSNGIETPFYSNRGEQKVYFGNRRSFNRLPREKQPGNLIAGMSDSGFGDQEMSLLSERREQIWRVKRNDLSPDSKDLFDDIEELEKDSNINIQLSSTKLAKASSPDFDSKDGHDSADGSGLFHDSNETKHLKETDEYLTPHNRMRDSGRRAPEHRVDDPHRFSQYGQRLSFSFATPGYILSTESRANRTTKGCDGGHSESPQLDPSSASESSPRIGARDTNGLDHLDPDNSCSDDVNNGSSSLLNGEDESERLARQLMEEEQLQLLERMRAMQQAEIQRLQREASIDSNVGGIPMDVLHEESNHPYEERIASLVGEDGEIDPDNMSYDQLLEIGECLGDVKQERWRVGGRKLVESLEVVIYCEKNKNLERIKQMATMKCLVCLYDYEESDAIKFLPCGHAFHRDCIDPWLKDHDTCATCKQSLRQ